MGILICKKMMAVVAEYDICNIVFRYYAGNDGKSLIEKRG
jgi:hypothetical protein